jgi:phosphoribosyl 1,2-cyclic phosphodiesterase
MSAKAATSTRLRLWGVRGSVPVPGPTTVRYGGNTSCVEVRADGEIIVLDAGTGIRPLGLALEEEFKSDPIKLTLLLTHAHWDHIQGLPFFAPSQRGKNHINIRGYDGADTGLRQILEGIMAPPFFPVPLNEMAGEIDIKKLEATEFSIGKVRVHSTVVNHPGGCTGYRLFTSAGSIAYLPDHEPYETKTHPEPVESSKSGRNGLVEFLRDADILILDTQYTDEEYDGHVGWGHGSLSSVVALALDARVHKLLLFHHDPNHDDAKIDTMLEEARQLAKKSGKSVEVDAAREGAEFVLG